MQNLVEITENDFDVTIDIRYASHNNLCGHPLYSRPFCYLHKSAIEPLKKAIQLTKQQNLKLKIWDCYRPYEVQKYMFDFFKDKMDASMFISDPKNGIKTHCRGVAIDLTLVDVNNQELDMGTYFDEFSIKSFHACKTISTLAQKNRINLLNIMTLAGFNFIPNEWWHYQLFEPTSYEIIEAPRNMISQQVLKLCA